MFINIIILLITPTIFADETTERKNETQTAELKKLEEERQKLFDEINKAIDESVNALQTANDSDAALGISYIKDLKDQIKLLNSTNFLPNSSYDSVFDNMVFRRKSNAKSRFSKINDDKRRQLPVSHVKKDDEMYNLDKIFGTKDHPKYQERLLNRIAMQQKLDQWILERQREKSEIKKYKALQKQRFFFEECPRLGLKGKKKKDSSSKSKKKKGKSYSGMRPCCRKCCKKSYMGCLRRRR